MSIRRSMPTTRSSSSSTRSILPAAEPERIRAQVEEVIGLDASDACMISAKTGLGVDTVLEAIVNKLPPPKEGDAQRSAQGHAGRFVVRRLSRRHRAGARHRTASSRRVRPSA